MEKKKIKRPELFSNIIGQSRAKLAITDWYLHEEQPLLIYGSSGFGKTMFAESLHAKVIDTTQLRGDRIETILKPIKSANDGDILFFDEIHSLQGKILEGLYKIIDKGTFYDKELCMDLPLPKIRYIFATNILNPLPEAFKNRCRFVELEDYTTEELTQIVQNRYEVLGKFNGNNILRELILASKGVPRTALNLTKSLLAGLETEKIDLNDKKNNKVAETEIENIIHNILNSRMGIDKVTGLNEKEYKIISKVANLGNISTTAIANILKISRQDVLSQYIEPLRASEWLAVSSRGVMLGIKGHENYRLFLNTSHTSHTSHN